MVLLALGSLSRMLNVVLETCLHQACADAAAAAAVQSVQAGAEYFCSEIKEWQALLLEKAGMLDTDALVSAICESHRDVLDRNDYREFARDDFQKLRLLIKGEIIGSAPVPSFASNLLGTHRSRERSILNFVARVPPASAKSAESAAEWLVEQARSKNEHMHSAVSFFGREVPRNGVDENVFDAACSEYADVSRQAKADIAE
jgi:hypothetical protein